MVLAILRLNLGAALIAPILISIELNRLTAHFGADAAGYIGLADGGRATHLALRLGAATVIRLQQALDAALHDIFMLCAHSRGEC